MTKLRFTFKIFAVASFMMAMAAITQAQATRTWVSGVGDDVNPCSRTAPCKTFAGAISKTATNGEINALDPGGFGAITITKSITIDGRFGSGGILSSGITGVTISLTASPDTEKNVRLRYLDINGTGSGGKTGTRGISVTTLNTVPVTVSVENCWIQNVVNEGILFNGSGGELNVIDTSITNCGTKGIMVDSNSTAAANRVHASLVNVNVTDCQEGLRAETNAIVNATRSNFSNNSLNGVSLQASIGGGPAEINLDNCLISGNKQFGIASNGANGTAAVRISYCQIVGNTNSAGTAQGISSISGGLVLSNEHNTVQGNNVNGAPTGTIPEV